MEAVLDPWTNFERGINCKATRDQYASSVRRFMKYLEITEPAKLLELPAETIENRLMDFIAEEKKNGVGAGLIRVRMAGIKKFYKRNRKQLNWEIILETIGRPKKLRKDRAYSHDELRKMLEVADERDRVIVLLGSSAGIRRGGILGLRKRNLKPIDQYSIYRITVYEGVPEEYNCFCSPECRKAIEQYFDYRKRYTEDVGEDSYVIRDDFQVADSIRAQTPRPVGERGYNNIVEKLLKRTGLWKNAPLVEGQNPSQVRHEVKTTHGFRKFFDTQMTLSGISEVYTQLLEGHEIGLKGAYLRPTEDDLLYGNDRMRGYVSAIDALTINEENKLKQMIAQKDEHIKKVESEVMIELADVRKEQKEWRDLLASDPELMMKTFQAMRKKQLGKV